MPETEALILVVDDQHSSSLEQAVQAMGYRVLATDNGFSALSLLNEYPVDLILLDMAMPGMDGQEVMRRIRAQPDGDRYAILVISGRYPDSETAARSLSIGVDDFLPKPINPLELEARLAAKLRQQRAERTLQLVQKQSDTQRAIFQHLMVLLQHAARCLDPESLIKTVQRGLLDELRADRATVWRLQENPTPHNPNPNTLEPMEANHLEPRLAGNAHQLAPGHLMLPMRLTGTVVGVLEIARGEAWPAEIVETLQALADTTGILLQNTRYVQQIAHENRFHELLHKLSAHDTSLSEMLEELGTLLGANLLLVDRWMNLIVGAALPAMVTDALLRPAISALYQDRQLLERMSQRHYVRTIEEADGVPAHRVVPVLQANKIAALLLAVPRTTQVQASDNELERAARFLAGVLEQHRERALHERHFRAEFINSLLSGALADEMSRTALFLRANTLGLNLAQPAFVAQIELPTLHMGVEEQDAFHASRSSELIDPLLRDVRRVRAVLNLDGLEVALGERVVAILSLPRGTSEEQARTWAARWAQQLMALNRQRAPEASQPAIGLGRLAPTWQQLAHSASEAERALRWVLSNARTNVAYYGDLGSERLLAAVNDRGELERFCEEHLGPVIEYDRSKEGELVRTLEVFFANGGHMSRAAEVLSVHPNTLKYRLDQVMHLTGRDPRDSAISLDLQLALKIYSML